MTFELNPIFILNNPTFRKIAFFDKKKMKFIIVMIIISTLIFTSFPLIAQVYIHYLYVQKNLELLMLFTVFFSIIYLVKLFCDINIEKYKVKYFLKIEKNLHEIIIKKNEKSINKLIQKKSKIFTNDIYLYNLLIRTLHNNFIDGLKIISICIIIFFFNIELFFYFLLAIPFFIIFVVLIKNQLKKNIEKLKPFESDFIKLLYKIKDEKDPFKIGIVDLELNLKKNITRKTSHLKLNEIINSFVSFYRLFYLTYFGLYVIFFGIQPVNLIIGLLFLTILIRSFSNLLKSIPLYTICSKSFFRINRLVSDFYGIK